MLVEDTHCGDKEPLGVEDWREMAMMAPLQEQHGALRSTHERRHESRDMVTIAKGESIERRQKFNGGKFNRKANANRDNGEGGGGGGSGGGSGGGDGKGDGKSNSNGNSNGNGNGNGNSNGNNNGNGNGNSNGNSKGNGSPSSNKEKDKSTTQEPQSTTTPPNEPTFTPIPTTPPQAAPPAAAITSADPQQFSSITPPSTSPPATAAPTSIPTASFFPIAPSETLVSQDPSTTPPPVYPTLESVAMLSSWSQTASSNPGRKGVDPSYTYTPDGSYSSSQPPYTSPTTTSSSSATAIPVTAIGDAAEPTQSAEKPSKQSNGNHHKSNLSPGAAQALIVLGVLGALVLLGFVLYLILRFLKVDIKGVIGRCVHRDRRAGSYGSARSWKPTSWRPSFTNWRRESVDEIPPPYEEAYAPEKARSAAPPSDRKFMPIIIPTSGTTPLVSNPAPFGASSPVEYNPSAGISYFITNPDRTTMMPDRTTMAANNNITNLERNVSNASAASNNATYFGTYNPNLPQAQQYNNQVRQSQGAYMGPNSRLSELSSLSSGFGDAKIDVPESGPSGINTNGANGPRKNSYVRSGFLSRFSWTTNNNNTNNGARDTVYTNTSEDSAPRFRTVTSWVNQQTSRVQKQNDSETPAPLEPVAKRKPPVTAAFQLAQARASMRHSRQQSQDGAFRAHPGQEVKIGGRGSRVASSILDGNFGGEEGPRYGRN